MRMAMRMVRLSLPALASLQFQDKKQVCQGMTVARRAAHVKEKQSSMLREPRVWQWNPASMPQETAQWADSSRQGQERGRGGDAKSSGLLALRDPFISHSGQTALPKITGKVSSQSIASKRGVHNAPQQHLHAAW